MQTAIGFVCNSKGQLRYMPQHTNVIYIWHLLILVCFSYVAKIMEKKRVRFLFMFLEMYNRLSPAASTQKADGDVLKALSQIIDPDFQADIVSCGFVKDLHVEEASGEVF